MKIAIRYGLIITAGMMAWTIIAHTLVPNPQSNVHSFGAFRLSICFTSRESTLASKSLEREKGIKPTFKEGIETGCRNLICLRNHISTLFRVRLGAYRHKVDGRGSYATRHANVARGPSGIRWADRVYDDIRAGLFHSDFILPGEALVG
jgi:hypothetical protein